MAAGARPWGMTRSQGCGPRRPSHAIVCMHEAESGKADRNQEKTLHGERSFLESVRTDSLSGLKSYLDLTSGPRKRISGPFIHEVSVAVTVAVPLRPGHILIAMLL